MVSGLISASRELLAALCLALLIGVAVCAETPTVESKPQAVEQKERLKAAGQEAQESGKLRNAGKLAEALALGEKALVTYREISGGESEDVASGLDYLADLHERLEDFAAARRDREEFLAIRTKLSGEDNWQTADARRSLAEVAVLEKLTREQREQLRNSGALHAKSRELHRTGHYRESLAATQQEADIRRQIWGEKSPHYASALCNLAVSCRELNDDRQAATLYQQALDIDKEALGLRHPKYAAALSNLADVRRGQGDCSTAKKLLEQALEIQKQTIGERDVETGYTLHHLGAVYEEMAEYAKAEAAYEQARKLRAEGAGEKDPTYAQSLDDLAFLYYTTGDYAKAVPLYRQSSEIYRAAYGDKHPYYATSLVKFGELYTAMGEYAQAESLLKQSLEIARATVGEKNPAYATSLNNLGFFYNRIGDASKAEDCYREALAIRKVTLGEHHSAYATSLNNLASTYEAAGDFVRAEPLYLQANEIDKQTRGPKHPSYATGLENLSLHYERMGDYSKAEPLLREALEIRRQSLGEKHPLYANSLNNLASLYESLEDFDRAEPLYRQAVAVRKAALGEKHPEYAAALNNLAISCWRSGDLIEADSLLLESADVLKRAVGEKHRYYLIALESRAAVCHARGDYPQAETLFQQAIQLAKDTSGESQPDYPILLYNLAGLYCDMGEYGKAEPLERKALEIARRQLDATAAVQSERQQLTMRLTVWGFLDRYLNLTATSHAPAEQAYSEVLNWKSEVGARQQQMHRLHHQLQASGNPTIARLDRELTTATQTLAALTRTSAEPTSNRRDRLQSLSNKIDQLQRQLADASVEFRKQIDEQRRTPDDVRKVLPPDVALVDFIGYQISNRPKKRGEHWTRDVCLTAFVVRVDRAIERIELGRAEPIVAAIETWRRQFGLKTRQSDPGADLRRLVWDHLETHLAGIQTVLIAPNDTAAQLPWGALPGKQPGTYLIDELTFATTPIPWLLPDLLSAPPAQRREDRPSLLLVGDVDFGADPGQSHVDPGVARLASAAGSAARGGDANWPALPGTLAEVTAIAKSFHSRFTDGQAKTFSGDQATKSAVAAAAAQYRYLHFSTHGFFASPDVKSALAPISGSAAPNAMLTDQNITGFQPGLLSGLVLAGANRPAAEGRVDGILTALEVAELDLGGVDLATLSACETGLGKTAGGEGLLGLQRAFQTAGAKSVVAGLWKVPDKATQVLMSRFYDNLWQRRMGKAAALREAQRWLLHEAPHKPELVRGLNFRPIESADPSHTGSLPPYYWAAFVLSGDWR